MNCGYETISFLSDYGTDDEFVGVVHSVLRSIAPQATIVDITHGIPPYDVRAGGLALARSAQYLCPGVVLAVVDPGVATDRRSVAVEVGNGESVFVGPDNGLLAPAVAMVGGASRAFSLTRTDRHLKSPGPTFAGRDVFAPAAAYLANGLNLTDLGEEIDPSSLIPTVVPISVEEPDGLNAEVLWIDHYGNAQLNVDPVELHPLVANDNSVQIRIGEKLCSAQLVTTFDEVPNGKFGLIVDSYGLIALVLARASAADDLGLSCGSPVVFLKSDTRLSVATKVDLARQSKEG